MNNVFFNAIFIFIFLVATSLYANNSQLGQLHFPITANKAAQTEFEQGVLYLHSFEYEKARAHFQRAKQLAPDAVMPYWGEAMTYHHPLWGEQDIDQARSVLAQLAQSATARANKAKTAREKGLIAAADILFGSGDKADRDCMYHDAMRQLYQTFPADDEIASFYALSLLGTTEGERDYQIYMQAAGIVEEILTRNPKHPGALHYAIHSYDDPIHAPLGLRAARIYANIAPDASHALHMPSHIFLALGLWDDVIASNTASWRIGEQHAAALQKYTMHDLHAINWLNYGYLQKREFGKALALVKQMREIVGRDNTPITKWYYEFMRSAYINESQDWNADLKSFDMTGLEISARASGIFTDVIRQLHTKHDTETIDAAIKTLDQLCRSIPEDAPKIESHADYYTSITSSGILAAKIMVLELRAQVKLQQGNMKDAINYLQKAIALEDKAGFGYGPPIPVVPAHEMLADVLLQDKHYVAAYSEYVKALKRAPNRTRAVTGMNLALDGIKESHQAMPEGIHPYYHKLMTSRVMKGM